MGCIKLKDGTPFNFHLFGGGREAYCRDLLVPRIKELKPDVFVTLLDTFMQYGWYENQDFSPAKTIWQIPSDGGGGLPNGCDRVVRKVNYPIAMSKFAQKQIKEIHNIDVDYIQHFVDEELFKPITKEEKEQLKIKYNLVGKYVVGLVGRNQGRKMHDRAIKAFAKWCKPHQEAVLMIHADPYDNAAVFDSFQLINSLGIQNRVLFTGMKYYNTFPYKQLHELYNLMDVYLSSTSGEGFGCTTIEAMSCEIPVLITAYSTSDELVINNNAGEGIKLVGTEQVNIFDLHSKEYDWKMMNGTITGSWTVERGLMDIDDCAEKLEKLYLNPELREKYGKNGRIAVLNEYTLDKVSQRWHEVLQKI
ncbi:MAG: glycosyltransferase family 4 protein [archaeon]|nr:glycosyltransferase family 4 protein [archaeon]